MEGEALCAPLRICEVGLSWNPQEMMWECQRHLPPWLGVCGIPISLIPPPFPGPWGLSWWVGREVGPAAFPGSENELVFAEHPMTQTQGFLLFFFSE